MNRDLGKIIKAELDFLENHPALNRDWIDDYTFMNNNLNICVEQICKNEIFGPVDKNDRTFLNEDLKFCTYKELYGEDWIYNDTRYFADFGLNYYNFETEEWEVIEHIEYEFDGYTLSGKTFEELIINIARCVRNNFGKFNMLDNYENYAESNQLWFEWFRHSEYYEKYMEVEC